MKSSRCKLEASQETQFMYALYATPRDRSKRGLLPPAKHQSFHPAIFTSSQYAEPRCNALYRSETLILTFASAAPRWLRRIRVRTQPSRDIPAHAQESREAPFTIRIPARGCSGPSIKRCRKSASDQTSPILRLTSSPIRKPPRAVRRVRLLCCPLRFPPLRLCRRLLRLQSPRRTR